MFKVDFNSKQFLNIEQSFKKDIKEVLASAALMREVGDFLVDRIKFQVRTEAPFNHDGSLPSLKSSTIKNRAYLEKYNATQATYEKTRSNLTITGKFLDALTYLVKGPGAIEILFQGKHPQYKGKGGKAIGKEVQNSDLAKWLAKKGFSVFDRSISDNKTIASRIKTIAIRYVRRGLKVRNSLSE